MNKRKYGFPTVSEQWHLISEQVEPRYGIKIEKVEDSEIKFLINWCPDQRPN